MGAIENHEAFYAALSLTIRPILKASQRSKRVPATKMESALMGRSHFSISR
ncbi:hypothetical protein [Bradyrhizobium erythrophlei]|jgi:hypothetical protein|uniref:Uncharacterized protein n=1 Tax=Bradyrhizobium erythrophlei TaxID=1437360 RepID=A0A1M7TUT6_9BRAD|nr:hypothetical protein [Bradyrhizobium erythrophlei]SHN74474.1 hypothetical protein SAMN05444170_2737 [Bradyrhizobium erythrophlei]